MTLPALRLDSVRAARRALATLLLAATAAVRAAGEAAPQTVTLDEVLRLAERNSPQLTVAEAQRRGAEASITTARARPNPVIEGGTGPSRYRQPGAYAGANLGVAVTQPIEAPGLRAERARRAEAGLAAATAASAAARNDLYAQVRLAFVEILRREGEVALASEDVRLLENVRERVRVRVSTGEAPRYELIRAESEVLIAQRARQSATLRYEQAKAALVRVIGGGLPSTYRVTGSLETPVAPPPVAALREELDRRHPELAALRADVDRAQARLSYERELRKPQWALRGGLEQDPDLRSLRLGFTVQIPLLDRREGPIAEAAAAIDEARARFDQTRLALLQELEAAYARYEILGRQVDAFESGLLRQAEAALKVAEAAYRAGERGILDFLDAQRSFRAARLDFLNTRFDLQNTLIEIRRLRALDIPQERTS